MENYIFDLAGVIINLDIERDTKALNYIGSPAEPRDNCRLICLILAS